MYTRIYNGMERKEVARNSLMENDDIFILLDLNHQLEPTSHTGILQH